jgi:hypothetical protein
MVAANPPRPAGFPSDSLLVLLELDEDVQTPLVRGAFRSLEELEVAVHDLLVERQFAFFIDDDDPEDMVDFDPDEHRIGINPVPVDDDDGDDLDRNATAEVLVLAGSSHHSTGLFVWDSEKKWRAYAPLKLYWCTTTDGDEDWFIVAHTATQAALEHARAEGYDDAEASAELIAILPEELQARGDDLLGWPDHDVLRACGAHFLREETPRVLEFGGRKFTEGMLEHEVRKLHDDALENAGQGRPNRTRRPGSS